MEIKCPTDQFYDQLCQMSNYDTCTWSIRREYSGENKCQKYRMHIEDFEIKPRANAADLEACAHTLVTLIKYYVEKYGLSLTRDHKRLAVYELGENKNPVCWVRFYVTDYAVRLIMESVSKDRQLVTGRPYAVSVGFDTDVDCFSCENV